MRIPPGWLLLLGTLLVIGALYNHYLGHSAYLIEIVLVTVGASLAIYDIWRLGRGAPETENGILIAALSRVVTIQQANTIIPIAGFILIFGWSVWKLFVVGSADLTMQDFIVTLFGLSLILYSSGPSRYTQQKDFIVLYLMFLTIIFVVIWNLYSWITGESYVEITAYAEYYFVTLPTVFLVNLFGFDVSAELDLEGYGLANIIKFDYEGRTVWLGIGTGCSGLYSAGLFFSAFLAFVLVRYRKVDRWILLALGVGFLVTWAANIFRMTLTVIIGSVYGPPMLSFFHGYIGIITFVVFVTIFWVLIARWLDRIEASKEPPIGDSKISSEEPDAAN